MEEHDDGVEKAAQDEELNLGEFGGVFDFAPLFLAPIEERHDPDGEEREGNGDGKVEVEFHAGAWIDFDGVHSEDGL